MADHGEDYETGKGLKNARSPLSEGLPPPCFSQLYYAKRWPLSRGKDTDA